MRIAVITVFLVFFAGHSLRAQSEFENTVETLLSRPEYKNASVGMHVVDLSSGETLYGLDHEKLLIPASTMKLVSSASAIGMLGADYTFKTRIGYTGEIRKNGTLKGDLVVIGGGDPVLGSEYFEEHYNGFLDVWAREITAAGITKIEGDLVLDASIYDSEKVPATWIWEDIGNYYGAGANALTVYDNLFRITFRSPKRAGQPAKIISLDPEIEGMNITNEVLSSDVNRDNAYVFGGPLDKTRVIRGTIPKNRKEFTIKAAIHNPGEVLANDLIDALANEGIIFSGSVKTGQIKAGKFRTIFTQESPTLAEIAKVLNYESVNLIAEHLVRQIAAEKNGLGRREDGTETIVEFWEANGNPAGAIKMEDGSGLSHFNLVSPEFFTALLRHSANNEAFLNSLPMAGKGTLKVFDENLFPGNTLRGKSGSMTRVRCYAGYLQLDSGKNVAFAFMFNHFSGSHSALIREIENLLYRLKTTR